jgi:polyhydroxyalkanoate synthase
VNPPTNPKASFQTSTQNPASAQEFKAAAEQHQGSWWTHCSEWIAARTGDLRPAPTSLGSDTLHPLTEAPGTYVFDQ